MAAIKRTPADDAFSKCIRERAEWKCERCNAQHNESSTGLHCSHHERRGHWGVRFNPLNAEALCYGCHSLVGGTGSRTVEAIGEGGYQLLQELKNDNDLGRIYKKTKGKGEIAKHYREEFKRMKQLRSEGKTGRVEFHAWY